MSIEEIVNRYKDCSIPAICSLAIHNGIKKSNYDTLYKEVKKIYSRIKKLDDIKDSQCKCANCGRTFNPSDTEAENKKFCCIACEYGI